MRYAPSLFILLALFSTSCVSSPPIIKPESTPSPLSTPTYRPTDLSPYPTATSRLETVVINDTQLYAGPGNRDFEPIGFLEANEAVLPLGVFGDFLLVSQQDHTQGFIWIDTLADLEVDLPQLDQTEVPQVQVNLINYFFHPQAFLQNGVIKVSTGEGEWKSPVLGPLILDTSFQIDLPRSFTGDFGAVTFLGNMPPFLTEDIAKVESGEVDWPIPQLIISSNRIEIADKDLSGGGSPFYTVSVPSLANKRDITVTFHDAQGRSFTITDKEGREHISLNVTELGSEALSDGLFPKKFVYASLLVGPSTKMKLSKMTLRHAPAGEYIQDDKQPSLRQLADALDLLIGTGTITYHLSDLINAGIINREFNYLIVAQFAWEDVQPKMGVFDFRMTDLMIDFAEAHDMKVQCADLIPPSPGQLPEWLLQGDFSREELIEILREHITTLVKDYRGRCHVWGVINEEVARHLTLPGGFWTQRIGPEVYELAFRWAHEADPNAILLLKDTDAYDRDTYWTRTISDAMYNIAKDLVEKGVPIDGVALQLHLLLADPNRVPTKEGLTENMQRFADLGLDIYLDEIDVSLGSVPGSQEQRWEFQAKVYADALAACLETSACRSYSFFEYTDRHSWLGDCENCRYVPNSEAHPFDKYYQPKPAYYAMLEVLNSYLEANGEINPQ